MRMEGKIVLEYGAQNKTPEQTVIKVLGIGGGGNNAVKQMIKTDVHGAEYYLINTEKQILERANTNKCKILQIGKELTNGMGAGADPQVGEKSARESQEEIEKILDGTDLLFLTAGMGGGTGTGAIPVIADIARKKGIMTIAVVTTPFSFEGKLRSIRAKMGIEKLKPNVNALIIINNDQLIESTDKNVSMVDAFKLTDDVLRQAVESITDLIYSVGTINVDFADVKTVMSYEGYAYMGIGESEGENKIEEATQKALSNPLIETEIDGAKGVIFNIKGGEDIGLDDINRSAELISQKVSSDANIIFGTDIDKKLGNKVVVTIVATGIIKEEKENL